MPPFGPNGATQLINHDIIERRDIIQLDRVSKQRKWEGPYGQHSRAKNSTTKGF